MKLIAIGTAGLVLLLSSVCNKSARFECLGPAIWDTYSTGYTYLLIPRVINSFPSERMSNHVNEIITVLRKEHEQWRAATRQLSGSVLVPIWRLSSRWQSDVPWPQASNSWKYVDRDKPCFGDQACESHSCTRNCKRASGNCGVCWRSWISYDIRYRWQMAWGIAMGLPVQYLTNDGSHLNWEWPETWKLNNEKFTPLKLSELKQNPRTCCCGYHCNKRLSSFVGAPRKTSVAFFLADIPFGSLEWNGQDKYSQVMVPFFNRKMGGSI